MKKNKIHVIHVLLLLAILLISCLTGCRKESTEETGTVDISIVDVSTADSGDDSEDSTDVESPETDAAGDEEEKADPTAEPAEKPVAETPASEPADEPEMVSYYFRNAKLLGQHYEKHGIEMGFASEEEYEAAASAVVNNPNALHKIEKEDGDDIYYVEETNDFVVVSKDGYIRTYFWPNAGIKYFNRQ